MNDLGEKIDELRNEMREGFERMRVELKEVRAEARSDTRDLRVEMNTRFDATQTSITVLWATMISGFVAMVSALIAAHF